MSEETRIIKKSYGNYSSANYGVHTLLISIGRLTIYFSYDTVVGFSDNSEECFVKNQWGTTTGKHLNWLCPNKKERLPANVFKDKLQKILKKHKLNIN